ncbi:MAG: hypothetical protein HGA85_03580 [Nanoarchaeota archaeon]|nr:hypothetical protein [Nanoarchaeota archaeon]
MKNKLRYFMIGLVLLIVITQVIAKESRESDEYEEDEDEEEDWDFSEDFKERPLAEPTVLEPQQPIVNTSRVDELKKQKEEMLKRLEEEERLETERMRKVQAQIEAYKNQLANLQNTTDLTDPTIIDSDEDGIADAYDRYLGKNDLDFQDKDNDGVIDSRDSDTTQDTDLDHDGTDDMYDEKDDRNMVEKILAWLGLGRR